MLYMYIYYMYRYNYMRVCVNYQSILNETDFDFYTNNVYKILSYTL